MKESTQFRLFGLFLQLLAFAIFFGMNAIATEFNIFYFCISISILVVLGGIGTVLLIDGSPK